MLPTALVTSNSCPPCLVKITLLLRPTAAIIRLFLCVLLIFARLFIITKDEVFYLTSTT